MKCTNKNSPFKKFNILKPFILSLSVYHLLLIKDKNSIFLLYFSDYPENIGLYNKNIIYDMCEKYQLYID